MFGAISAVTVAEFGTAARPHAPEALQPLWQRMASPLIPGCHGVHCVSGNETAPGRLHLEGESKASIATNRPHTAATTPHVADLMEPLLPSDIKALTAPLPIISEIRG